MFASRRRLVKVACSSLLRTAPVSSTGLKGPFGSGASRLSQTLVFVQSGLKISEVPLVVQKVSDVLKIQPRVLEHGDREGMQRDCLHSVIESRQNPEMLEIIAGLRRCFTAGGIFRLLEMLPAEEVTPSVALEALELIIHFDLKSQNPGDQPCRQITDEFSKGESGGRSETFLRYAFVNMLLDIVYRSPNPRVLIGGLKTVCPSGESFPVASDQNADLLRTFKRKLFEKVLLLITEGKFSLVEICEVISTVGEFYKDKKKCHGLTDKLWSGLLDKAIDELNEKSMAHVFRALPHLRQSRSIVLNLLEEKVGDFWQKYKTEDVLEMLCVLKDIRISIGNSTTSHVMQVISQWLTKNFHLLGEDQLQGTIFCYSKLEYVDDPFINVLERYIKARGCQIKDANLVAAICDYSLNFRIRSKPILEGVGEYFITHGNQLSTPQLNSIARIYGELDFHPPNGFKFWELLEHVLKHNFVRFPPNDVINLLLSFIYIERFPLNFVRKLFNPNFLDRMHNQQQHEVLKSRELLKLFDVAMKQDCQDYGGPFLSEDRNYRTVSFDSRIKHVANFLMGPLGEVVGDVKRIGIDVVLPSLPRSPLYVADAMIYPSVSSSLLRFGMRSCYSQNIVVLIHTPEHYDRSGQHLVGLQAMRVRHIKKMGFKVMELKYSQLSGLYCQREKLLHILEDSYEKVVKSE